jgi:hypothetical protein
MFWRDIDFYTTPKLHKNIRFGVICVFILRQNFKASKKKVKYDT